MHYCCSQVASRQCPHNERATGTGNNLNPHWHSQQNKSTATSQMSLSCWEVIYAGECWGTLNGQWLKVARLVLLIYHFCRQRNFVSRDNNGSSLTSTKCFKKSLSQYKELQQKGTIISTLLLVVFHFKMQLTATYWQRAKICSENRSYFLEMKTSLPWVAKKIVTRSIASSKAYWSQWKDS